jgi:hypothetical protein
MEVILYKELVDSHVLPIIHTHLLESNNHKEILIAMIKLVEWSYCNDSYPALYDFCCITDLTNEQAESIESIDKRVIVQIDSSSELITASSHEVTDQKIDQLITNDESIESDSSFDFRRLFIDTICNKRFFCECASISTDADFSEVKHEAKFELCLDHLILHFTFVCHSYENARSKQDCSILFLVFRDDENHFTERDKVNIYHNKQWNDDVLNKLKVAMYNESS